MQPSGIIVTIMGTIGTTIGIIAVDAIICTNIITSATEGFIFIGNLNPYHNNKD
jgi:hypothetical protein